MLPIADYPEIVRKYLHHFEGILSKPQLEHLAEYLTGLFVCDNHTVQGINDSFIEHKDQSALNRFLTESEWSEEKLNDGSLVRWLKTNLETVGERCRLAMAEVLKGFVIWVLKQRESGNNLDEMMWRVFASRQEVKGLI